MCENMWRCIVRLQTNGTQLAVMQFPISSKGGSFPRKKGGGGAPLARPLILLQEKRAAGPRLAKRKERAIELVEEFIALIDS